MPLHRLIDRERDCALRTGVSEGQGVRRHRLVFVFVSEGSCRLAFRKSDVIVFVLMDLGVLLGLRLLQGPCLARAQEIRRRLRGGVAVPKTLDMLDIRGRIECCARLILSSHNVSLGEMRRLFAGRLKYRRLLHQRCPAELLAEAAKNGNKILVQEGKDVLVTHNLRQTTRRRLSGPPWVTVGVNCSRSEE